MVIYVVTEMMWDFLSFIGRKIKAFFNAIWTYLSGIVTRVIDKAYADAGIDHLVTEEKK
jgi:hypothetical protein